MSNDVDVNVDELRRFAAMAPVRSEEVRRRIASQHFIRHIKTFDTFHASKRDAEYYSERRWALSHFRSNRERARVLREQCLRNTQRRYLKHCANVRAERRLRGWLGWALVQRLCWGDDCWRNASVDVRPMSREHVSSADKLAISVIKMALERAMLSGGDDGEENDK